MGLLDVNYVAVLVASIVSMIVGFIWYSKRVFGGKWMKNVGLVKLLGNNRPGNRIMGIKARKPVLHQDRAQPCIIACYGRGFGRYDLGFIAKWQKQYGTKR